VIGLALLLFLNPAVRASAATAWHVPNNSSDLGFNMRNPELAIGTGTTVTFYTGVWKYNNEVQLCNQTGGTLFYKSTAQTSWSSTNLNFYSSTAANQYWPASVNCSQFNFNDTVQYYFLLTFDGTGGVTNTWLYGNDAGSTTTGSSSTAAASPFAFAVSNNAVGIPVLTVNGLNGDYTTEHLFVDEVAGDSIPVNIVFSPNADNVVEADVFSNLNRRNRATLDANGDGIEDGIVPPDGNTIPTGDDNNYYKAYAMTAVGGGQYALTLYATNCGAYRLTARYKIAGNTNWFWYGSNGRRDHCLVVTPPKARDMVMYELNVTNPANPGIALVNPAWIPLATLTAPNRLNWSSVSGQVYQVVSTTNLPYPSRLTVVMSPPAPRRSPSPTTR
jgi:hypothetical protein